MTENEFLLQDRLGVIRDTIKKYGEENFYQSFSGGKDSMALYHLINMAVPDNRIPRVYINTGIEYNAMVEWVKELSKTDDRIIMIQPQKNIKESLKENGYPFKSKIFSDYYASFLRNKEEVWKVMKEIENDPSLKDNYDYIHNLSHSTKWVIKEYYGLRERDGTMYRFGEGCPQILRYLFKEGNEMNISDKCCTEMKEKPLDRWRRENKKPIAIIGLMADEGGRRVNAKCTVFKEGRLKVFQPLAKVTKEWEDWFIQENNIRLCKLYYEPYNFVRSGCKGCPFNLKLEEDLATIQKYFENEYKQCQFIWKPVYDEYRRLGYRLSSEEQMKLL